MNVFLSKYKILLLLIVADFVLIALHILFSQSMSLFHLDMEHNLPTVYQSTKLLAAGFGLAWGTWLVGKKHHWWIIALLMIYLGLDEIGQIHEHAWLRLQEASPHFFDALLTFSLDIGWRSSFWIFLYIPIFVIATPLLIYATAKILKEDSKDNTAWPAVMAVILFSTVILFEMANSRPFWSQTSHEMLYVLEEWFEMIGASLLVFWVVIKWSKIKMMVIQHFHFPNKV